MVTSEAGALAHSLNEGLYRNALLYFIKYCNNDYLGKTKLNKLLYYFDFISFRDKGKSATGDIYIHEEYGPIPAHIDEVLASLQSDRLIDTKLLTFDDKRKFIFELKDGAALDESVFSSYQKNLLHNICTEFGGWSRDKIVNQTHLEAPWFFSKPYEIVDYAYSNDIDFFRE